MQDREKIVTINIKWSEEDYQYVATCKHFPSLSWLSDTPESAEDGMTKLVQDVIMDLTEENIYATDKICN